jgi:hypothetical protein
MLDAELKWYGISQKDLAEMMRMSVRTLQRRMADPTKWTVGEVKRLGEILGWNEREYAEFVGCCISSQLQSTPPLGQRSPSASWRWGTEIFTRVL